MVDDRREAMRRVDDYAGCLFHLSGESRVKDMEKVVSSMNTKINIGVGLVLAATLIITVLFYSLDKVEAHVTNKQVAYEQLIKEEQKTMATQLGSLRTEVSTMGTTIAVLSTRLGNYNSHIVQEREEILQILKDIQKDRHDG